MVKLTEDLLLMQSSGENSISISESSNCPSVSSTAETNSPSRLCSREPTTISAYRKINCWGSEIDDISIISQMPELEVVILSSNAVEDLSPFANCKGLSQLTLRKNNVSDLKQLEHLQQLEGLKTLWLMDNPVAEQPNYRQKVIQLLPQLNKLDRQVITEEERKEAAVERRGSDGIDSGPHNVEESHSVKSAPQLESAADQTVTEQNLQPAEDLPLIEEQQPVQGSVNKETEKLEHIDALEDKPLPSIEIVTGKEGNSQVETNMTENSESTLNEDRQPTNEEQQATDESVPTYCLVSYSGKEMAQTSTMAASQEVKVMGPKLYSAPVSGMMFTSKEDNDESSHQESQILSPSQVAEGDEEEEDEKGSRERRNAFRDARSNTVQAIELLLDNVTRDELRHLLTVISSKLTL